MPQSGDLHVRWRQWISVDENFPAKSIGVEDRTNTDFRFYLSSDSPYGLTSDPESSRLLS